MPEGFYDYHSPESIYKRLLIFLTSEDIKKIIRTPVSPDKTFMMTQEY